MKIDMERFLILFVVGIFFSGCTTSEEKSGDSFPPELVKFTPFEGNPVFEGGDKGEWDELIRERGFILKEDALYRMWYTGYKDTVSNIKYLGYATSTDGIQWKRHEDNPVFTEKWTEDMFVQKVGGLYYMFAEGTKDRAHLLSSSDGIQWEEEGDLVIKTTEGEVIEPPYGTPTLWIEDGKWHLFYERNDRGVWLATSEDKINWKNVQDDPVLPMGPGDYDKEAVAANQIVKQDGYYYLYYHATGHPEWMTQDVDWSSNVARSKDLIHWEKYSGNPLVEGNYSSPILVFEEGKPVLYTMHARVDRFEHKN